MYSFFFCILNICNSKQELEKSRREMNSELAELRDRIAELELEIEELKSQNARKDEEIANLQNK